MQTKVVVFDFSTLQTEKSAEHLKTLLKDVAELDVSILVNNVGLLTYGSLEKISIRDMNTCININVNAITYMSMFLLPKLPERKQRSAMINVTSKLGTM